jgi:CRISPR-associated protein Csb2
MPPEDYLEWRKTTLASHKERRLAELLAIAREKGKSVEKIKLGKKDLESIEKNLPEDLFHALHADTGDLKNAGWSQPPGSIWVTYIRQRDAFDVMPRARAARQRKNDQIPTVARFALASQVMPRLTDAVSLAERIHIALVSRSDGVSVFTGCDESGKPLEGHRHACILCESNPSLGKGRRGEITHITIYAPMGFDSDARKSLDGLTRVWGHGGHDIQLILLGVGQPEDFAGLDASKGACPMLAESMSWVSRTPFVSTRHPKATKTGVPKLDDNGLQIGSAEHELRRLLKLAGYPSPCAIESVPSTDLAGHETRWLKFRRDRNQGDGRRATSGCGYGFRIRFPEMVRGPIALGYGAHFGLGLFVPESP